ncbi:hypothetical protein CDAR_383071 [Caerostris darwini]|uniref:Alpha-latrotoxin n=1 Tax=Caerostris darwini TaxID=1538125 RepID=A0AAV4SHX5_9ARAC|nr:hypothetical protein CDAR_383071 [Caerostris darwini]
MGANINISQSGREPLHEACQHDKLECAGMLFRYGANVNSIDNEMTPLCIACECSSTPGVELLLKMNADVNTSTNRGTCRMFKRKSRMHVSAHHS